MPPATEFTALGVGNGFPFCPAKVDVSVYDYWTSLGGWSEVNEPINEASKKASIEKSRRLAMALFWNLDGWTGRLYYESFGPLIEITSLSMKDDDWTRGRDSFSAYPLTGGDVDDPEFDPMDRVCYKRFDAKKYLSSDPDDDIGDFFRIFPDIVRMYEGDTGDEDNFRGYGFSDIGSVFGYETFVIRFESYANGTPATPTQTDEDISYTEIPTNITDLSIPCVGKIEQGLAFEIPEDFNTYSWEDLDFAFEDEFEAFGFRIDSLDFYTYPA